MVASSQSTMLPSPGSSSPSTSPVSAVFVDHSYSKTSESDFALGPQLTTTAQDTRTLSINMDKVSSGSNTTIYSSNVVDQTSSVDSMDSESRTMDVFQELDDLDFDLTDIDMESSADEQRNLQDLVDTALHNTSCGTSICEPCSPLTQSVSSFQPATEGLASPLTSSQSTPSSSCPVDRVPTKTCCCVRSESTYLSQTSCVYATCHQQDGTTLSPSTVSPASSGADRSGVKLKPGDYLPPIFIDTGDFGLSENFSLHSPFSLPHQSGSLPHSESAQATIYDSVPNKQFEPEPIVDLADIDIDEFADEAMSCVDDLEKTTGSDMQEVSSWLDGYDFCDLYSSYLSPPPSVSPAPSSPSDSVYSSDSLKVGKSQTPSDLDFLHLFSDESAYALLDSEAAIDRLHACQMMQHMRG